MGLINLICHPGLTSESSKPIFALAYEFKPPENDALSKSINFMSVSTRKLNDYLDASNLLGRLLPDKHARLDVPDLVLSIIATHNIVDHYSTNFPG